MAKNKGFNLDSFNKFLQSEGLLFEEPETLEDGTIKTPRYSTGIELLDVLLNGGFPQGKAVAISAERGAGKTTILIQAAGNIIEKYDKRVYYIDVEGGATYELFQSMGFDNLLYHPKSNPAGKLYLLSASTIQDIATIIKQVTQDDDTALIIVDSDTATSDARDLEEADLGTGKHAVGKHARMWSEVSRALNAVIKKSKACLIIVHQARVNLSSFMATTGAAGGNALKHLVSAELWGRRVNWIDADGKKVRKNEAKGTYINLSTDKNRLTMPFVSVEFPLYFGRGVSNLDAYKQWLESKNYVNNLTGEAVPMLVKKGAGYYTMTLPSGEYKCQGDSAMNEMLVEHLEEIKDLVKSDGGFKLIPVADDSIFDED